MRWHMGQGRAAQGCCTSMRVSAIRSRLAKVLDCLETERKRWATEVMEEKVQDELRHLQALEKAAKRLRNEGLVDEATFQAWQKAQALIDVGAAKASG